MAAEVVRGAGSLRRRARRGRRRLRALEEGQVEHLYVDPGHQGAGIGSALLDLAKEARPGGLRFWVFQRNDPAPGFYEKHGCRLVKTADGAGIEEREPDALYEWQP
jgi:ribosomal protein S18 acetylase RimI-like enzyme